MFDSVRLWCISHHGTISPGAMHRVTLVVILDPLYCNLLILCPHLSWVTQAFKFRRDYGMRVRVRRDWPIMLLLTLAHPRNITFVPTGENCPRRSETSADPTPPGIGAEIIRTLTPTLHPSAIERCAYPSFHTYRRTRDVIRVCIRLTSALIGRSDISFEIQGTDVARVSYVTLWNLDPHSNG